MSFIWHTSWEKGHSEFIYRSTSIEVGSHILPEGVCMKTNLLGLVCVCTIIGTYFSLSGVFSLLTDLTTSNKKEKIPQNFCI